MEPEQLKLSTVELIQLLQHAATREDISELRASSQDNIDKLRIETKSDSLTLRQEFKNDFNELKIELKADILALRQELKNDFNELKIEFKSDILALRQEFKSDILALRQEFKNDFNELKIELKADINLLRTEDIANLRQEIKTIENKMFKKNDAYVLSGIALVIFLLVSGFIFYFATDKIAILIDLIKTVKP